MNAIVIQVQIVKVEPNGISFTLARQGGGDDMVEAHAAYIQAILCGAVAGLRELKGSPEPPDPSEDWKRG